MLSCLVSRHTGSDVKTIKHDDYVYAPYDGTIIGASKPYGKTHRCYKACANTGIRLKITQFPGEHEAIHFIYWYRHRHLYRYLDNVFPVWIYTHLFPPLCHLLIKYQSLWMSYMTHCNSTVCVICMFTNWNRWLVNHNV